VRSQGTGKKVVKKHGNGKGPLNIDRVLNQNPEGK